MKHARVLVAAAVLLSMMVAAGPAGAGADRATAPRGDGDVAAYWTPARMAAAIPRDLVVDQRGLGYLRRPDGSLQPHGHRNPQLWATPTPAARPTPAAKPGGGGGGDTTGPTVSGFDPPAGATIGASWTFQATVTDPSGVRSVTFTVVSPSGQAQSFAAAQGANNVWSVTLNGFTDGQWRWRVVAKDGARKPNTTTTSPDISFTVSTGTGGSGGGGTSTIVNDPWPGTGTVQTAAGRLYFEMPANSALTRWSGYVCSGTVATDGVNDRSVILTASHCVYDDVEKVFARNVMFIPDQDGTTGSGTDLTCSNDPLGCWKPSFGVVDVNWTTRTFPDNIRWDYAYYVVADSGAHTAGLGAASDLLESAAGSLGISFAAPTTGVVTDAIGYSYSDDPNLMYCAEGLAREATYGDWWLGHCGLSGGASGGPWLQPASDSNGPIISVNSWGYTNQPGMAGPQLSGTSASCVFSLATTQLFPSDGTRGYTATCP
ncbi:MAG TPA: hypothetical protein VFV32_13745 [Acidimicrobiales bacterium]|nr:hypothetical protein [Acidimicrobiales bacterium]